MCCSTKRFPRPLRRTPTSERASEAKREAGLSSPSPNSAAEGLSNARSSTQETVERLREGLQLHRKFRLKTCDVATDRSHRQNASAELESHEAIPGGRVALDHRLVPALGVADIVDRQIVMLAPEERRRGEFLARAQQIARGGIRARGS